MKKVVGTLLGVNANAIALRGHFRRLARDQGFDRDWIDRVSDDALSGDYDHVVVTLSSNMTMTDESPSDLDEEE